MSEDRKKVLLIGGSYFVGRVFCIQASMRNDTDVYIVNRGRIKVNRPHITELVSSRHDIPRLRDVIPPVKFDAVIDFCAYEPDDIASMIDVLQDRAAHYLYLSTSNVYDSAVQGIKTEQSLFATQFTDDPVSQYEFKKMLLETELNHVCTARSIPYTIIRPSFIYGPFNYAPRESWFIEKIVKEEPVPKPVNAEAQFSMVFVVDLAKALNALVGREAAFNAAFNAAAPEPINYPIFFEELERCNNSAFPLREVTVEQVLAENIPLPFPLNVDELCDGSLLARVSGVPYTPFSEGMGKTFSSFKNVYAPQP